MFKVNNKDTRTTPGVLIVPGLLMVNFECILHLVLVYTLI